VALGIDCVFDVGELEDWIKMFPAYFHPAVLKTRGQPERPRPGLLPEITEGMVRLGYPAEDFRAVLGENFLPVDLTSARYPSTMNQPSSHGIPYAIGVHASEGNRVPAVEFLGAIRCPRSAAEIPGGPHDEVHGDRARRGGVQVAFK
jgi:hypothetical protein